MQVVSTVCLLVEGQLQPRNFRYHVLQLYRMPTGPNFRLVLRFPMSAQGFEFLYNCLFTLSLRINRFVSVPYPTIVRIGGV